MSLDWDLGRIKNWKEVCQITATKDDAGYGIKEGDVLLSPVTKALIWATMAVGMRGITEENYREFYARLRLVETTGDAFLWRAEGKSQSDPENFLTLDEVRRHIGLGTNVSPQTAGKWSAFLFDKMAKDAERDERQREAKLAMKPVPKLDIV